MKKQLIKGKPVDKQTRCEHYQSELDIIAIKFKCCNDYYPCFSCHAETTRRIWPVLKANQPLKTYPTPTQPTVERLKNTPLKNQNNPKLYS